MAAPLPSDATRQVKLKLVSQSPDIALPENAPPIIVNTNLRRYALSTLVNHLLENEKPVPFEFLVNGTFLRTSIDEYLTENGISAETLLTLEYVRAITSPSFVASFEHDDWISSLDVLSQSSKAGQWAQAQVPSAGQERILSGSYDGQIRVWSMSSQVTAISPKETGHTSAVKAVKMLSPTILASASLDRSVRVWGYEEERQNPESTATLKPLLELYGHKKGVNAIDVHSPSSRILSASNDLTVGLWSTEKSGAPAAPEELVPQDTGKSSKRRKLSGQSPTPQRGPLAQLKGHNGPVQDTCFAPNDHTVAYSASWDHTLRTWDLPTASLVDTRTTSHPLLCVQALQELNLIAVGTSVKNIVLVDPRASAATVSAMTLRGHTNWVSSLSADPQSHYGLLSGSYDGTCRIWDLRSTRSGPEGTISESIYTLQREWLKPGERRVAGEGVKVLSTVWDKDVGIISGGEDKKVQINRGTSV